MAVWVLVFFWVTLGLGVFVVAMRGGGRRADASGRGSESRASRRTTAAVLGVLFLVFGVALPAVVLATQGGEKTKQAPGGVDLTASQANGRKLFSQLCATCHTLRAVN